MWEAAAQLDWYAEAYGWTWDALASNPQLLLDRLPEVRQMRQQIQDQRQQAADAAARAQAGAGG